MANNQGYYSNHKMMSLIKNNEAQKNILKKQLLQGRKLTNALESPTQYNKAHNLEMNLNVLKKSLENITEAKNTSEIIEKALLNIITIFQNLLDLNLQARQPGLSNLDLVLITDSIKSLETELQASLELYKYNNKTLFHCKDRLNYRECYKKESDSWRKFFLQS